MQVRRSYPEFIREFDRLVSDDVIWQPYVQSVIAQRAPHGLSTWCGANITYWFRFTPLVYDIHVESYCSNRVLRQFGYRQTYPIPPPTDRLARADHG